MEEVVANRASATIGGRFASQFLQLLADAPQRHLARTQKTHAAQNGTASDTMRMEPVCVPLPMCSVLLLAHPAGQAAVYFVLFSASKSIIPQIQAVPTADSPDPAE